MRLDQSVAARFPEISRRKARALIAARRVLVNDHPVAVASREVAADARITIVADLPPLDVIAIHDEWIAINKPAGLPTQPARDRRQRSLEELLRVEYGSIYLVHRLDTPTSGVVVFARTGRSAARLSHLFASREIRKVYLARVDPPLPDSSRGDTEMIIQTPIDGKEALTIVRPRDTSLVEVEIKTGRTHQIRRHLQSIGHPVAGDHRYGRGGGSRLMLHAWIVEHQELGRIVAPPPPELTV